MGCGCGKNKTSRRRKASQKQVKRNMENLKAMAAHKKNVKKKLLTLKAKATSKEGRNLLCLSCPYSVQTKNERARELRVCHKTNRLIINLVGDIRFECPIKRFGKLK